MVFRYDPVPTHLMAIGGRELRRVLCVLLADRGPQTVAELGRLLTASGFRVVGRPSKEISDALRWEIGWGRAVRMGRGLYGPGSMPRSTEYRVRKQVRELRSQSIDPAA